MTNAELAILGLIGEGTKHGYQIERLIEERGMRNWTEIGFSSIYYLLKKLEKKGLVKSALQETNQGPVRKIYRITKEGEQVLREGVIQALSTPQRCMLPIQIGLAEMPLVDHAKAIEALYQYKAALGERLDEVRGAQARQETDVPYYVEAQFGYSIALITAEIKWLETFIERLEDMRREDMSISDWLDMKE